jgi:Uma2 family endonuclease
MATVSVPARRCLLLDGIEWQTYSRLLRVFAEHRGIRLNYDRGVLEIMSPLFEHEFEADLLGRFVVVLTEELSLPLIAGGSTTLRRRRLQRGLEPDRCWWIAHALQMRGKRRLDLRVDPPPDLALEVDVTNSSVDRMGIYAALRVPEVWRFDGQDLTFHHLGTDGRYAVQPQSLAFPGLTPADLLAFLALRATLDDNAVVTQFRTWVHQHLAPGGLPPAAP